MNGDLKADAKTVKALRRREALTLRAGLDPDWHAAASTAIMHHLLTLPELHAARTIALYASFGHEIDTYPLIDEILLHKGSIALPRALKSPKMLEFRRLTDFPGGCLPGYADILEPDPRTWDEVVEPAAMDLIIVPGLLFDPRGYRIGYGGGYYDHLLAQPGRPRAIGIVFTPLLTRAPWPLEPWDVPVDAICTEQGVVKVAQN